MQISRYVFIHKKEETSIVYNTINKSILNLSNNFICINGDFNYKLLTKNQLEFLRKNNFIVESREKEAMEIATSYNSYLKKIPKILYLTIELTTQCNLKCSFCYQEKWKNRKSISEDVCNNIVDLIFESKDLGLEEINLNFIGGEPLLMKKKLLNIYNSFKKQCILKKIKLTVKLNTNGILLDEDFINQFDNISVMLPLATKLDYGKIIFPKKENYDIYSSLIEKVLSLRESFNQNTSRDIVFRFNANKNNIKLFPEYVHNISKLKIDNSQILTVYTTDCVNDNFENGLTLDEFRIWNSTVVIEELLKYNFELPFTPRNSFSRCKGRRDNNFKVFADGRLGLCNGVEYDKNAPFLFELVSLKDVNQYYQAIKSYHYIREEECSSCQRIFTCGGGIPCKLNNCEDTEFDLALYLEKYIKYCKTEKKKLFI